MCQGRGKGTIFHTNHLESGSSNTFLTWIHLLHVQILFTLEVNYSHKDSHKSMILGIYMAFLWGFCFFWGIFSPQERLLGAQESRNIIVSKSIGTQDLWEKKYMQDIWTTKCSYLCMRITGTRSWETSSIISGQAERVYGSLSPTDIFFLRRIQLAKKIIKK